MYIQFSADRSAGGARARDSQLRDQRDPPQGAARGATSLHSRPTVATQRGQRRAGHRHR